jgi:hypothetical protein
MYDLEIKPCAIKQFSGFIFSIRNKAASAVNGAGTSGSAVT